MAKAKTTKKAAKPAVKKSAKAVVKSAKNTVKKAAKPAGYVANQTSFEIESGLPIPARRHGGTEARYPFASLQPGTSFFVPAQIDTSNYQDDNEALKAQKEAIDAAINRMTGAARRYVKRSGVATKFVIRADEKEVNGELTQGVRVFNPAVES